MLDEARAHAEVRGAILKNAVVPPIDLAAIRRRMRAPAERPSQSRVYARVATAAALLVAGVFLTARAPALMQGIEERYRAILAADTGPGVSVAQMPAAVRESIVSSQVTLSQARQRADFTIVEPQGLPRDVVSRKIVINPQAAWSKQTNKWSVSYAVSFDYVRADGRKFSMIANRFSSLTGVWPAYVYDVVEAPHNRRTVSVGKQNFVWRNGDQVLQVVATSAISAEEIARMRVAMSGTALPRDDGHSSNPTKRVIEYTVQSPQASAPPPR